MKKLNTLFSRILFPLVILCFSFHSLQAQWEYVGSPAHAGIIGYGSDDNFTYAATGSAIYYTNDQGNTWNPTPNNTPFIGIRMFKVIENKLYVMANSLNRYDQIFVSEDGGNTWQMLQMINGYGTFVQDWVVRGDTVVVAQTNWVLTSYDGGMTVGLVKTLPDSLGYIYNMYWVGNALMGRSWEGTRMLRSTDFGASWSTETLPADFNFIQMGDVLWRKELGVGVVRLSKSEDAGQTFEYKLDIPSNYLSTIYVSGIGEELYVLSTLGDKIMHTTDGGDTWSETEVELNNFQKCHWNGNTLFSLQFPNIQTSSNGGISWNAATVGPREGSITEMCFPGNGNIWAKSFGEITKSTDGGQTWSDFSTNSIQTVASSGNGHMVGVSHKKIYISEDYGVTWQLITTLNPVGTSNVAKVSYLGGKFILYYPDQASAIISSDDGGYTWNPTSYQPGSVRAVEYNDGKFICHLHQARISASDNAINWLQITGNLFQLEPNDGVNGIYYADSTFLVFDSKMYRKNLLSFNWALSPYVTECCSPSYNLPKVEDFASYNDVLLAGVRGLGVYASYDNGMSWLPFNDGLANPRVNLLHIDGGYLYAGMVSGGIWRRPVSQVDNYNVVQGHVFSDENENGILDNDEPFLPNITVRTREHGIFVQTDSAGAFTLHTNYAGADTIEVSPFNDDLLVTTPGIEAVGSVDGLLLGVKFIPAYNASIDLTNIGMARPGFEFRLNISGYYAGNTPSDLVVTLFPDSNVVFIGANPSTAAANSDSLVWLLPDVQPGQHYNMKATFYVPPSVPLAILLNFGAHVTAEGADEHPQNNTAHLQLLTVGSYDPNEKAVFPAGEITPQLIADTLNLTYTIRFQNLGNYQADHVRISDTLSELLDLNSLRVISASHDFSWQIRPGRILEFNFPYIALPDTATNEPGSHGFVKYSIDALPHLEIGDAIQNRAHIYFDFNLPIATNQTESIIVSPTSAAPETQGSTQSTGLVKVYPNPAGDYVSLDIPDAVTLPAHIQFSDATGRVYKQLDILQNAPLRVDVSALPKTMLYITIQDGKNIWHAVVVKM